MSKKIIRIPLLFLLVMMVWLSACLISDFTGFFPAPATPTPEIMADCFVNFYLSAWEDIDGNGVWDPSEQPLEGVEFHIDGQFGMLLTEYPCFSNADGDCLIFTWTPGFCFENDYTIIAVSPEGYEPTTDQSITFTLASDEFQQEAQFGFRPISD